MFGEHQKIYEQRSSSYKHNQPCIVIAVIIIICYCATLPLTPLSYSEVHDSKIELLKVMLEI